MSSQQFYRRQAEACLRLATECGNSDIASRYRLMAQDFLERADGAPADPKLPLELPARVPLNRKSLNPAE